VRIALMVEGQEGVTWDQWVALGRACDETGIEALFRSDHYAGLMGEETRGSLDAWTQIAALAAVTERVRLGTMVSPVTFRHPSLLAKAVVTADHVSGGRVELGLGTGWNAREHAAYGFPFPELPERLELLEEQTEIVVRQWTEDDVSFEGRHYRLEHLTARPRPLPHPRPRLILGGSAKPRTLRLALRFADEYNSPFPTLEEAGRRAELVRSAGEEAGRPIPFTVMTGCVVGRDRAELRERVGNVMRVLRAEGSPEDFVRERGETMILGTVEEVVERIRQYEAAGVGGLYLQHLAHDDVEMVRLIGAEIAPVFAA
jgi:F420-dependent oxidoreductase-like protein